MNRDLDDELGALAAETYIYLLPAVMMDLTRRASALADTHRATNNWQHVREVPQAGFRTVVRPNADTLYSSAWLDLRDGPIVVSVPATDGRYASVMFYDYWTDVFSALGSRTNGAEAGDIVLCDPAFTGEIPHSWHRVTAPTSWVWALARCEIRDNLATVHHYQDQLTLRRVNGDALIPSALDGEAARSPLKSLMAMSGGDFYELAHRVLTVSGPHLSDDVMIQRARRVGLRVGDLPRATELPDTLRQAWEAAPQRAQSVLFDLSNSLLPRVRGWMTLREGTGGWGNAYARRALISLFGLGANPPEDSLYPTCSHDVNGDVLDGSRRYRISFAPGAEPPVTGFWSVTAYDARGFFLPVDNARHVISSRQNLVRGDDGWLHIFLGPRDEGHPQWLATTPGPISLTARLYLPQGPALAGRWDMPAVIPVD